MDGRRRRRARAEGPGGRRGAGSRPGGRASGDRRAARPGARRAAAGLRPDVLGAEVGERAVRHRRRSAARASLQEAHDRAVRDALGYLEREAAVTRRGPAGVHAIAGNGFVAAGFRHRTSRAGDPQLHTHVLVANLTLGADGQWSTLDGRRIYAHAKTAGFLYEARLRSLLTRELGVEWTPVRNGIADVAGVPPRRAAGVQPPADRDRGRARTARSVGRRGRAGRHAGDPARQGLSRDAGAARARVARACGRPRPSAASASAS